MRVDIYRRAEHDGIFSYLAVPEGKIIPEEVTNTTGNSKYAPAKWPTMPRSCPTTISNSRTSRSPPRVTRYTGLKDM